jgi:tetratricopeptide (TPR) repeat protein
LFLEDLRSRAVAFPASARIVNRLARVLHESGRNDEAFEVLAAFLAENPPDAAIRQTQLDILVKSRRWKDALKLTAEKLQADPSSERDVQGILEAVRAAPEALNDILASAGEASTDKWRLYLIGAMAADAGRNQEAEKLLRDALALDAGLTPARAALAELQIRRCDYAAALQAAARADDDEPEDARLERTLARAYDRLDELDRAEVHYRAALQIDRADVRSMLSLADVYRRANKGLQAQHQLRALLELRPTHEPAREMLALLLYDDRKPDAARAEYAQLEKLTNRATTKVRCKILMDAKLLSDPAERRRLLLEAIEQSGPDAPALAALAETYEDEDPEKAREYYARAVTIDPDDEESLLGILRALQHQLALDKVAAGLEDMLRCRPNRHVWRRMLAGMYGLTEQFDRAFALLEPYVDDAGLENNRRNEYRETLIETLREAGRGEEAIARLRAWSGEEGEGGAWAARLAQEQMRQRRFTDAVRTYTSLLEEASENRGIRDRLLEALLESRQFVRAEQHIVEWFAEDPENDRLVLVLAQAISRAGRVDEAVDLLETWLTRTQRRELFQNMLVSIYAVAGRHEDCARLLDELSDELLGLIHAGGDQGRVAIDHPMFEDRRTRLPNEPFTVDRLHERYEMVRLARVTALGHAGDYDEAQELLNELLEFNPEQTFRLDLMARQASLYRMQGKEDDAVAILQAALPKHPNKESLSNDIAYSWIDRGVRLDEADKLIRFAVGRIPRQAAYLDTYGWLLYKEGDIEGARLWLSRANRVRGGDDPVIHDHLGDALWRLGRKDEAIEQWSAAVELVHGRTEHELSNDDERRVARVTQRKIEDARTGREPQIAALGAESPGGTQP